MKYPFPQVPQVLFVVERYIRAVQDVQVLEVEVHVTQLGSHGVQSDPFMK